MCAIFSMQESCRQIPQVDLGYPLFDIVHILSEMRKFGATDIDIKGELFEYCFHLFIKHLKKSDYPKIYSFILTNYIVYNTNFCNT